MDSSVLDGSDADLVESVLRPLEGSGKDPKRG